MAILVTSGFRPTWERPGHEVSEGRKRLTSWPRSHAGPPGGTPRLYGRHDARRHKHFHRRRQWLTKEKHFIHTLDQASLAGEQYVGTRTGLPSQTKGTTMKNPPSRSFIQNSLLVVGWTLASTFLAQAADEDFDALVKRLQSEKPAFAKRHRTCWPSVTTSRTVPPAGSPCRAQSGAGGRRVASRRPDLGPVGALSSDEIKARISGPPAFTRCLTRTTKRAECSSRSRSLRKPRARPTRPDAL
jgi:hypothetical protein